MAKKLLLIIGVMLFVFGLSDFSSRGFGNRSRRSGGWSAKFSVEARFSMVIGAGLITVGWLARKRKTLDSNAEGSKKS